ncbi:chymotrypsin-like elastase family member 2A isoform X2 [Epargyreus clarus]|uniref:chymotrypsin-like elastase family member 2A isoform X2 n=1 Tax=Epargyreus clarus TaxID=520877 RepID=UPI003C2E4ADE
MIKLIILFLASTVCEGKEESWSWVGNPLLAAYPCNGSEEITLSFEPGLPPEEENQYSVSIDKRVPVHTKVELQFDSEASVILSESTKSNARISSRNGVFTIRFFREADSVNFQVKGPKRGTIPYFKSLKINTQEYCDEPNVGFLDRYIEGYQDTAAVSLSVPDGCGRRKVEHTELIVAGQLSKPGDWPWHVAIYKRDRANIKYICGGTLISKAVVLTAAHCVTLTGVPVVPEILSVILGKYNLIGGDLETQEREVLSVIAHEDFAPKRFLENDIALLKLKSEATYSDYVQPACIWYSQAYERLPTNKVFGTVVGWGFDQTDTLSTQLQQSSMPKISDAKCIKKNPLFYGNVLNNNKKFCAGYANGTSACNGDSGGGFVVFVPDTAKDDAPNAQGSWYVRGIVSMTASRKDVAICDPHQYVVFTDVAKYTGWIKRHMEN